MTSPFIPNSFTYGDAPQGGSVMPMVLAARNPSNTIDIQYASGYLWLSDLQQGGSGNLYVQSGNSAGLPNWTAVTAGAAGALNTLSDGSTTVSPSGGNIAVVGTANQVTVTSSAPAHELILTLPSNVIFPGAASTTTNFTVGTNLVVNGTITVTGSETFSGNVTIGGTLGVTGATTLAALTVVGTTLINNSGNANTTIGNSAGSGAVTINTPSGNFSLTGNGNTVGIANDAAANLVTVGSTTGVASLTLQTGTGNMLLTGSATSKITLGSTSQTGDITVGQSTAGELVSINSAVNTAGTPEVDIANGANSVNTIVKILSGVGTGGASTLQMANNTRVTTIDLGNIAPAAARLTTIAGGNQAQNDVVTILGGNASAGTQTFNLFSGNSAGATQTFNLFTGTGAGAVNIGTGATGVKTIAIGGTAANVITLANTQTAGSLTMGNAMTTGTIQIGGATQTGATAIIIGPSTAAGGATFQFGNAVNTGAQVINIASGASATGTSTVNLLSGATPGADQTLTIMSGVATAGTQSVGILGGANTTGSQSFSVFNGAINGATDTINLLSGAIVSGTTTFNLFNGNAIGGTLVANIFGSTAATTAGTVNIGTGAAAHVTNIGSATGGNITLKSGSGNTIGIGLGGNAAQIITIGAAAQTGKISIADSTAAMPAVDLMNGVAGGAQVLNIASGTSSTGAQTVNLLNGTTPGASTTLNIMNGAATAGTQAIAMLSTGATRAGTYNIGDGNAAHVGVIGSTTASSSLTLQAGSGTTGLKFNAAGNVQMVPSVVSAAGLTVINNARVGQAVFTGQTTGAGVTDTYTITNSAVSGTTQAILISCDNLGTNDAQMTITRVKQSAGSIAVQLKNNGAAALNGDVHLTFWILN